MEGKQRDLCDLSNTLNLFNPLLVQNPAASRLREYHMRSQERPAEQGMEPVVLMMFIGIINSRYNSYLLKIFSCALLNINIILFNFYLTRRTRSKEIGLLFNTYDTKVTLFRTAG